ncbi:MAG: hypothetical protein H7245_18630 [Candidatus Saccharibacteria bacterium]|nr:hypothetical protein [Pseudorhodobacter sp.]
MKPVLHCLAGLVAVLGLSPAAPADMVTVGFSQIGSQSGWRAAETAVTTAEALTPNMAGPPFDMRTAYLRYSRAVPKSNVTPSTLHTQTDDLASEYRRRKTPGY